MKIKTVKYQAQQSFLCMDNLPIQFRIVDLFVYQIGLIFISYTKRSIERNGFYIVNEAEILCR